MNEDEVKELAFWGELAPNTVAREGYSGERYACAWQAEQEPEVYEKLQLLAIEGFVQNIERLPEWDGKCWFTMQFP